MDPASFEYGGNPTALEVAALLGGGKTAHRTIVFSDVERF